MANTFDNAARDTNPCLPLTHDLSRFEEYKCIKLFLNQIYNIFGVG